MMSSSMKEINGECDELCGWEILSCDMNDTKEAVTCGAQEGSSINREQWVERFSDKERYSSL